MSKDRWLLVEIETNKVVPFGPRESFRGESGWVISKITQEPGYGRYGKVLATHAGNGWSQEYHPNVFGLKIVQRIDPIMAGCLLDGVHGWHNEYRVVDLAREYGFTLMDSDYKPFMNYRSMGESGLSQTDMGIVEALVDDATRYLNDLAPEGYVVSWVDGDLVMERFGEDDSL